MFTDHSMHRTETERTPVVVDGTNIFSKDYCQKKEDELLKLISFTI